MGQLSGFERAGWSHTAVNSAVRFGTSKRSLFNLLQTGTRQI